MKIRSIFLPLILLTAFVASAAIEKPVSWTAEIVKDGNERGTLVLHASVKDGWHIYGLEIEGLEEVTGTPDPTTVAITPVEGLEILGKPTSSIEPAVHFDSFMNLNLPWLAGDFSISQPFTVKGVEGARIEGTVRYMACNETACTPPTTYSFDLTFGNPTATTSVQPTATTNQPSVTAQAVSADKALWWEPVEVEHQTASHTYWGLLIVGFLGGLIALMTPCVWPMIPMTVSFFLKKGKSRRRSIFDAVTYSVSIVVIFLVLGLLLTLIFGPGELNKIATGAVFNLIFFALLVVFAISFFGAFEITLPSKWSNAMDSRAESTTGLLSIFFMAFTLVLVSFSCTGPIIGTLLVEAFSQEDIMGPFMGMAGFALGLALPFGLFAFFPTMLKELPRSGSWLNTVKVVLGFVELILSLKFLSVADLAYGWHILDREVFISLWIVLFALLGMYLLGKLRFSHDGESSHTSVPRFFMALASFAFAVYLLPGLWGAPLKAVSAFAPPLYTQDFNLYGGEFEEYDDYDEGMEAALKSGKPVLLDFSGYACVNCRKMEGAIFDTPTVRGILEKDFVMIKLMVDDKAPLAQPITVEEEGQNVKLTTVGDKWSYLQRHKFATNQQPFYVMLDNEGKPLAAPCAYEENVGTFVAWLEKGIQNYKE
ncbi:MAG: thioredoxin family protein [Muribaculaceae bacterium]|nr:thioredoxin family protein [Muribaculaceae bacterium]